MDNTNENLVHVITCEVSIELSEKRLESHMLDTIDIENLSGMHHSYLSNFYHHESPSEEEGVGVIVNEMTSTSRQRDAIVVERIVKHSSVVENPMLILRIRITSNHRR